MFSYFVIQDISALPRAPASPRRVYFTILTGSRCTLSLTYLALHLWLRDNPKRAHMNVCWLVSLLCAWDKCGNIGGCLCLSIQSLLTYSCMAVCPRVSEWASVPGSVLGSTGPGSQTWPWRCGPPGGGGSRRSGCTWTPPSSRTPTADLSKINNNKLINVSIYPSTHTHKELMKRKTETARSQKKGSVVDSCFHHHTTSSHDLRV